MIKLLELLGGISVKVHSDGNIETLPHNRVRSNGRIDNRKGRILKPSINRYGYAQVVLTVGGVRKTYLVHRLVASAFLDNQTDKPTVNHINGNKLDNRVSNLEWASYSEQKRHAISKGLCDKNVEALARSNARKSISVIFRGVKYNSIKQAARENGVHERVIRREGVMLNG